MRILQYVVYVYCFESNHDTCSGCQDQGTIHCVDPDECHREDMTFFPHSSLIINKFTYIKYSFSLFYNAPGTFYCPPSIDHKPTVAPLPFYANV